MPIKKVTPAEFINSMNKFNLTLRTRVYISMLMLILVSFIVTGITAYYNFHSQNEEYQEQRFLRKEHAVQESMNYFLEQQQGFIPTDSIVDAFSNKICELADVHNLPIAIFDTLGNLLISSTSRYKPDIVVPDTISQVALAELNSGADRAVVETILSGTKPSILAYWTFENEAGKRLGITSVRYDKAEVQKEEIRSFLSNLAYIFLALFVGASILAFILSNYITKSLQTIADSMHKVKLGKTNKPIEWKSKDEIGQLVKEYNRMVVEVEKSADLLAKKEKESAWREMAKQVAHEIKNPLTPMKLRVQHLKRAWEDKAPNFGEKLNVTTNSLIEQIDALTNIANEFSNFAKMPKAKNEVLNLVEIIEKTIALFKNSKNIRINYLPADQEKLNVLADKDQLTRVFINLLTNAIQSIPADKNGLVTIQVKAYSEMVIVEIKDNGTGIDEELKDKIFSPNFTTKTTGTGLGLSMVKNIIENAQGDIWFKTKKDVGTSFYVSLPLV